nr:KAT8 regulatory NSL complex subunit 3 [Ipomoea batatas]
MSQRLKGKDIFFLFFCFFLKIDLRCVFSAGIESTAGKSSSGEDFKPMAASRVSYMVASGQDIGASAVVCLGYPLKGINGAVRDEILLKLRVPIMFVQLQLRSYLSIPHMVVHLYFSTAKSLIPDDRSEYIVQERENHSDGHSQGLLQLLMRKQNSILTQVKLLIIVWKKQEDCLPSNLEITDRDYLKMMVKLERLDFVC